MKKITTLFFPILLFLAASVGTAGAPRTVLQGPYDLPPIHIQVSSCESIAIGTEHLKNEQRLSLRALKREDLKTFIERRELLLKELSRQLRGQIERLGWLEEKRQCLFKNESRALEFARDAAIEITKVFVTTPEGLSQRVETSQTNGLSRHDLGILVLKDLLETIDLRVVENARNIVSCEQFGYCTSAGANIALGFRRLFVGFGAFLSRDTVRSFERGAKWETHYNIDVEVGTHATTPTAVIFAGIKVLLHFDRAPRADITDFTTTYYPGVPISTKSAKTAGLGALFGLSGVPVISNIAWFESRNIRVQPTWKAFKAGCETLLSITRERFKERESSPALHRQAYPPDDIQ